MKYLQLYTEKLCLSKPMGQHSIIILPNFVELKYTASVHWQCKLVHMSLVSFLWEIGKQGRPRSDVTDALYVVPDQVTTVCLQNDLLYLSVDLTKGSFGHISSFCAIKISKTSIFSRFCMFLQ